MELLHYGKTENQNKSFFYSKNNWNWRVGAVVHFNVDLTNLRIYDEIGMEHGMD